MTAARTFGIGLAFGILAGATTAQQAKQEVDPTLALAAELLASLAPADDDPDQIARRLLEAAFRHPTSPAAGQLAQRAEQLLSGLDEPEALHDWLSDHPVQEAAHGLLARRIARIDLALRRRLELPLPRDPFPEFAREVQAIGPFGDPGSQWLDVIFPPDLVFPTEQQQLTGRFGPVTVRKVDRNADTEALRLQPADQEQLGCYFVRWTVEATQAVAGFLEVRYRGSLSARVNGVELGRRDPATEPAAPQQCFAVRLNPGTHQVLIKTGDRSNANLALRFIDAKGRPLAGVIEATPNSPAPSTDGADPRDAGRFRTALQEFRQAIARHGRDDQARLLAAAAWTAQSDNETDQVLELVAQLKDESIQEALAQLTLANVLRGCRTLPNEQRTSRARAFEEQAIVALPPTHYAATRARIRHLADEDKREEALAIMQQAVDEDRAGPNTFMRMLATLQRLRFTAEIPALLTRWAQTRPNDPTPHIELSKQALNLRDKRGALEHARRALAASPDSLQARQQVYQLSLDLGRFDLAHEMVVRMPVLGDVARKFGVVRAAKSAAEDLLREGANVLVYPGGDVEALRPWRDRNKIVFDGRKGFLKLAHARRVKIVPVVAIGGQETFFVLNDGRKTARLLRFDKLLRVKSLPISVSFPWGLLPGDLPHIPFPAKIRIQVLPPIDLRELFGDDPDWDQAYGYVTSVMQVALSGLAAKTVVPVMG